MSATTTTVSATTTTTAMATAESSSSAMATTEPSAAAMATTETTAFMSAKAARMGKAAVAAERIVMSVAVMVFPIMVVSEIRLIVVAAKKSI
jgi:hypothetical protein